MKNVAMARLVGVLYRQSLNYMHYALKSMGITPLECIFLAALFDCEGASQEQLCSMLVIDKSATAKAMKSLEDKGLVKRDQCLNDKRAKRISTTAKARGLRKDIDIMMRQWVDFLTEDMESGALDQAVQSLNAMATRAVKADHQALLKGMKGRKK